MGSFYLIYYIHRDVQINIMLPIQYTYLFGACLFLIPWVTIFYLRKDLRPVLVWIGLISILPSLIAEYNWWTQDWWQPQTITNTKIGIEDVILSFTSVGVAATLYPTIMKRKFIGAKSPNAAKVFTLLFTTAACLTLFFVLFQSGINSFVTTLIVLSVATTFLVVSNHQLVIPAITSGFLMVVMVLPVFLMMFAVTPLYVERTWMTQNLLGIYPLGIPIEDILFYIVGGSLSFSVFPYITGSKLVELRSLNKHDVSKARFSKE